MTTQLPSIFIVAPIFLALINVIWNNFRVTKILLVLLHVCILFLIVDYRYGLKSVPFIHYEFGGWPAPFGIEFVINKINLLFMGVLYFISAITILFAWSDFDYLVPGGSKTKFFSVYFICLAGFSGIILTNDIFNMYVFIEIASLAIYSLAAISKNRASVKSSLDYLILGTFAATFFLFGIGFIYISVGSLNMTDIAHLLVDKNHAFSQTAILSNVGFIFIVAGLIIKFALFPFHKWLVDIYCSSNYFITIFFSAVSTKVMIFTLFKLQTTFFNGILLSTIHVDQIITLLALCGIIFASYVAIFQANVRSVLSYSSVAQIGYIIIALLYVSRQHYDIFMAMVIAHAFAKMLLFMVSACLNKHCGGVSKAIILTKPYSNLSIMVLFIVAAASIVGVPGTVGFMVKINLLMALLAQNFWLISAVLIVGSVLSLLYFWRLFEVLYQAGSGAENESNSGSLIININQKLIMFSIAGLILVLGIFPTMLKQFILGF